MCSKANKRAQLGMNHSTAQQRLVRDLLFKFVVEAGHKCHHCGQELDRDTFTINHTVPWMYSEDPLKLFFDTDNISYSHMSCNSRDSRGRKKM